MTNVTISPNDIGVPVQPVDKDAPTLRLTTSGIPIVITPLGAPFILSGGGPGPDPIIGWNDDSFWSDIGAWDDDGTI